MAGTLEITDEYCWMPAGWLFDNVLDRIAAEVESQSSATAEKLHNARTDVSGGYLDLRSAPTPELELITKSAETALMAVEKAGADSFYDPSSYPGFIQQFQSLNQMLRNALNERYISTSPRPSTEHRG
jgi:hypothetical protein